MDNEDIGYLQHGQSAEVKVHAFDFLRFGSLSGKVERIAVAATLNSEYGAHRYGIIVETEQAELTDGEDWHPVVLGMSADVDFLIRKRTILSYLTDRIFRHPDEVFREG